MASQVGQWGSLRRGWEDERMNVNGYEIKPCANLTGANLTRANLTRAPFPDSQNRQEVTMETATATAKLALVGKAGRWEAPELADKPQPSIQRSSNIMVLISALETAMPHIQAEGVRDHLYELIDDVLYPSVDARAKLAAWKIENNLDLHEGDKKALRAKVMG